MSENPSDEDRVETTYRQIREALELPERHSRTAAYFSLRKAVGRLTDSEAEEVLRRLKTGQTLDAKQLTEAQRVVEKLRVDPSIRKPPDVFPSEPREAAQAPVDARSHAGGDTAASDAADAGPADAVQGGLTDSRLLSSVRETALRATLMPSTARTLEIQARRHGINFAEAFARAVAVAETIDGVLFGADSLVVSRQGGDRFRLEVQARALEGSLEARELALVEYLRAEQTEDGIRLHSGSTTAAEWPVHEIALVGPTHPSGATSRSGSA